MKKFLLYICILFSFLLNNLQSYAQTLDSVPGVEEIFSLVPVLYVNKDELLSFDSAWKYERGVNNPGGFKYESLRFERILDNNYYQVRLEFRLGSSIYYFNLIQQEKSGRLVYFRIKTIGHFLFEIDNTKNFDSSYFFQDEYDFDFFGNFCGLRGGPPRMCNRMLDLVMAGNYEELSRWLQTHNPERSAYGYMGIQFLYFKDRINIRKKERDRMKILEKSSVMVFSCKGCMYGFQEKMKDVVNHKNLENAFNNFSESGYFRIFPL